MSRKCQASRAAVPESIAAEPASNGSSTTDSSRKSAGQQPAAKVESRRGAVAWAFWRHPVSPPRSSNRTCGFPASGFPTGFIARHTAGQFMASVLGAGVRVLHKPRHRRTFGCHAQPLCAVWRGSRARAHRHNGQRHGMPSAAFRSKSNPTSRAVTCSACRALRAMDRDCLAQAVVAPLS